MQEKNNDNYPKFFQTLLDSYNQSLKSELNLSDDITSDELKKQLIGIINEYELEFYNDYTDIFIYQYYKNLINNHVIDDIINFVQTKKPLNDEGKEDILKSERASCQDVLWLYDFNFEADLHQTDSKLQNKFVSQITGRNIYIDYPAAQIITNSDIFNRPPKGDPNLRGPHINYTIEYSPEYWLNFKSEISKYVSDFQSKHSDDYLEDLDDYRYWINKYRSLKYLMDQTNILNNLEGGKHVKN